VSECISLVKWSSLSLPKKLRGYGLKNIYRFSKSLMEKTLWHLVYNDSLWGKVMKSKYL
jgi:hypothetical protein